MDEKYRVCLNFSVMDPTGADHTSAKLMWHDMTFTDVVMLESMMIDMLVKMNAVAVTMVSPPPSV